MAATGRRRTAANAAARTDTVVASATRSRARARDSADSTALYDSAWRCEICATEKPSARSTMTLRWLSGSVGSRDRELLRARLDVGVEPARCAGAPLRGPVDVGAEADGDGGEELAETLPVEALERRGPHHRLVHDVLGVLRARAAARGQPQQAFAMGDDL
jgi:hypothetical protein